MKTKILHLPASGVALLLLFCTSCNDGLLEEILKRKGLTKKAQLQEMIHNGRHYAFNYDKRGFVDYIDVSSDEGIMYTYQITYKKHQLYAAQLIENGEVISENHDFEFDAHKNIVGYTYSWYTEDVPGGVHVPYSFTYDDKNRLTTAASYGDVSDTYSYDAGNNVMTWTTNYSEATYTYDDKLNPLNRIPDLFALFVEEAFIWEFALSEHNSTTRIYVSTTNPEGQHTTYTNEYDAYYRLTSKTDDEGNGFTFIYH